MPLRFRKSLKLGKGVHLNLSKGGISTSLGGKGFTLNVGKRGIKATSGLPGTGLSYSQNLTTSHSSSGTSVDSIKADAKSYLTVWGIAAIIFIIMMCVCGCLIYWALSFPPAS